MSQPASVVLRRAALAGVVATVLATTACTVDGSPVASPVPAGAADSSAPQSSSAASGPAAPIAGGPSVARPDGSIRVTAAPDGTTPKVVITLIEDPSCPYCKAFEAQFGDLINSYQSNPQVAVDRITVTFLDRVSPNQYSSRAANASSCVAEDSGPRDRFASWLRFRTAMYQAQPDEGSAGPTDDALATTAMQTGTTGAADCIRSHRYANWVTAVNDQTTGLPDFKGTPTVRINGTDADVDSPDALRAQIQQALAR